MTSTECHLENPAQEELFSTHLKQEDPMDQGHWTAGTLDQHGTITAACIFKFHQWVDTEHQPNTSRDSMTSTECHLDHPAQEEPFSIHQKQEDPMDQEHWNAGTLPQYGTITAACIFKFHQWVDTEHQPNTRCNPHMSKYRGKPQ